MTVGGARVRVCDLGDLEDGEIFKAEIEGIGALAIYRIGDDVFASSDICTHGEASLSEDGYLEDFNVVCSWHNGAFDVRTGEAVSLPCMDALKTYPVAVEGDTVYVAT